MTRLAAVLTLLTGGLFLVSLLTGPADLGVVESMVALVQGGDGPLALVMRDIRLPRAVLAVMIGASLGLSGAAMQGYLRNPLAEPGLIGVSGSAALGAVIALQTGLAASFALGLPLAALAGALIAVLLVMVLAGPRGSSLTLILAGIWMMGSLADRSMTHVWLALPFMVVGWLLLGRLGRGLDALTLGEDAAQAMGIRVERLRLHLIVGTACVVGAGTAVAGAIGFVGLVVPHILRPLVGAHPSRLLWASALGGAAMVLAADIAVRVVLPTRDLKLGVLTALVGAPLFLHLILKLRRERI
jgi:iron complex transport system permease protein